LTAAEAGGLGALGHRSYRPLRRCVELASLLRGRSDDAARGAGRRTPGWPGSAASHFGLLVSRDGFNGVSTHYSSGGPSLPQRNKPMKYSRLQGDPAAAVNSAALLKFAIRSILVGPSPNPCAPHKDWANGVFLSSGVFPRLRRQRFRRGASAGLHAEFV